jgi:hypothetical protein
MELVGLERRVVRPQPRTTYPNQLLLPKRWKAPVTRHGRSDRGFVFFGVVKFEIRRTKWERVL